MLMFSYTWHYPLHHFQFAFIRGPNSPGSCVILFFIAWTLLSLPDASTSEFCFCLGPAASFFLELFPHSSSVVCWTPADLGTHLPVSCLFAFSYYSWHSWGKNTEVICHSLLQWTTFCQNSPPWPVGLGWPCTAWLIDSLSYTSLWSMWSFWLAFCDCGFRFGVCGIVILASSVCPMMDENKRLAQDSWWERLLWGKLGLALVCSTVLSKFSMQLSACSLPVVWPEATSPGIYSPMVGLLAVSKRTYASIRLPGLLLPVPLSLCQASAHPHLCSRSSDTPRRVWLSLLWGHCSFPLGSGAHMVLFVPSKSLCFPQSCGSSVIISCCPSKSDSLGIPSPLLDPQVGKWCGAWNLCNSVRTCVVSLFSSVWDTHLVGLGFNCNVIVPLLLLFAASPLCLDTGMFFWWVPASSCRWLFNS